MRDQSARDAAFSMTCARCSGRVLQLASFCPHCGARLALAGGAEDALREHGGYPVAAERFEPPMRSFAPADFEGDLDAPSGGAPDALAAAAADELPGQRRGLAFLEWREWGLKSRVGLILAACVVVFGGFAALHRYDGPSVSPVAESPVAEDSASKSAGGSMRLNDARESNLSGPANDIAPAPAVAGQGASGTAPDATTPPVADAGAAQKHSRGAGAAQGKHGARSKTHVRPRPHAHQKKRHAPSANTYLHVDVLPQFPSARSGMVVAA